MSSKREFRKVQSISSLQDLLIWIIPHYLASDIPHIDQIVENYQLPSETLARSSNADLNHDYRNQIQGIEDRSPGNAVPINSSLV
jgi:hypothetical protein